MLGFDNLIRDMIQENLGMTPDELKAHAETFIGKAKETIDVIVNNQNVIYHQNKRIIELLEKQVGVGVIEPPISGGGNVKPN